MGFSYLKSKGPIFASYRTICSKDNLFHHQGRVQKASLLALKALKNPVNLSPCVRNKVHVFSPVMCLFGSPKLMNSRLPVRVFSSVVLNSRLLLNAGRRFFHGNRFPVHVFSAVMLNSRFLLNAGRRLSKGNRFPVQIYTRETRLMIPQIRRQILRAQRSLVQLQREIPWSQLCRDPKFLMIASCISIAILFGRIERIPVSGRFHFVLSCKLLEGKLGDSQLRKMEEEHQGMILPPNSPQSVRVHRILREIIQGMHSGLRLEKDCRVRVHQIETKNPEKMISPKAEILEERRGGKELVCKKDEERMGKRKRRFFGWGFATKHMDGLNWQVMVVDSYMSNACYLPNGKIVFYTGLLRKLKSDAEVAAVIGHEVGHGIARHASENFFRLLCVIIFLILIPPENGSTSENHPISLFLNFISRRREMEADYIGMMLMAAAGYDPRLAPEAHLKVDDSDHHSIFSTHPCGRKREEKLKKPKLMDQAVAIYREVTSGNGVRSFI